MRLATICSRRASKFLCIAFHSEFLVCQRLVKMAASKLFPLQVEEPVKPLDEKQKAALTAAYKMPQSPCIMVHPNPKAKSGKFDCSVVTLSSLLDYRPDDNKEATFEGLSTTLPHFCCAAPFLSLKRNTGCSLRLPEIMDNSKRLS